MIDAVLSAQVASATPEVVPLAQVPEPLPGMSVLIVPLPGSLSLLWQLLSAPVNV